MQPVLVVTRPQDQQQPLMDGLSELGLSAVHLPLLRIEHLPVALHPEPAEILIVTSPNAVAAAAELLARWPGSSNLITIAVGSKTAACLRQHGVSEVEVPAQMQSEGILGLPALNGVSKRILIVKGQGGREYLPQQLKAQGHHVECLDVYRRLPADSAVKAQLAQYLAAEYLWLLTSGEAMQQLFPYLEHGELNCITSSRRLAELAKSNNANVIAIADNASDAALLKTVRQCLQP